ncbi:DNA-protecting protein DprA [Kordia sp. YSTF-M3]|uniref:DNA-protecting protein DprA n=1 Tax=Kordia aestuariivivens TaxID=2759037 RepID=A0ABR7Q9P1_9FLAO|nr:DNA-processing protein DprA [Kordia aestuariivivens]MBC8755280.1 DNA-protecting protein DprA [Kordia aestuariivivens]
MNSEQELLYTLALQKTAKVGDVIAKKLIRHCGSAEAVLKETKENLLKIDGIGTYALSDIRNSKNLKLAEKELAFVQKEKITVHYFLDETYPNRLQHCIDSPILLFQKGNVDLNASKMISIVGTRKATTYGTKFCEQLIEDLSPIQPTIVSGFAYGIDIVAQRTALKNNIPTVGCLAHGLNQIYPKVHEKYVRSIQENGGFVTDFWSTSNPDRENFLKRNRLIAGMTQATIVIESAEKGGSLVTAHIANSYNRDVFAVPGRVGDTQSIGCNNLIKQQRAHILTSAADIVYLLGWELETEPTKPVQKQLFVDLNPEEATIHSFLQEKGQTVLDSIALACKLPIHKVAPLLLQMEMKGVVKPLPGKLFEAV